MTRTELAGTLLAPDVLHPDSNRLLRWAYRIVGPGSAITAAVLFAFTFRTMHQYPSVYDYLAPVFASIVAAVVIAARFAPVLAFVGALIFHVLVGSAGGLGIGIGIPVLICVISGVAFARLHGWLLATALLCTALGLPVAIDQVYTGDLSGLEPLLIPVVLVLLVIDGLLIWRKYRAQGVQLAEVRQDAETQREQRRHLEERSRIAREMHDVVAHHMSMVAVKASTAEYRLDDLSESGREEFRAIADTARASLTEMRRILSVFRSEDESAERAPQPGIERIDALCQGATDAGVEVTVTVSENLTNLPDAVSLTAYRIVQEALSNVVRHAPGATTTIELYPENGSLVIVAMNDAAVGVPPAAADPSGGLGLAGMRERVELLHGELFAEPIGRSGFLVKARLPLELVEET